VKDSAERRAGGLTHPSQIVLRLIYAYDGTGCQLIEAGNFGMYAVFFGQLSGKHKR